MPNLGRVGNKGKARGIKGVPQAIPIQAFISLIDSREQQTESAYLLLRRWASAPVLLQEFNQLGWCHTLAANDLNTASTYVHAAEAPVGLHKQVALFSQRKDLVCLHAARVLDAPACLALVGIDLQKLAELGELVCPARG